MVTPFAHIYTFYYVDRVRAAQTRCQCRLGGRLNQCLSSGGKARKNGVLIALDTVFCKQSFD